MMDAFFWWSGVFFWSVIGLGLVAAVVLYFLDKGPQTLPDAPHYISPGDRRHPFHKGD